jgi:ribonuclease VapC
MFVDASALVAILLDEPERSRFADEIEAAAIRMTSAIAVYETVVALMRKKTLSLAAAEERVSHALLTAQIEVVPITDDIGRAALDAFDRYGKGRGHPAQLNMGDCFAYGAARVLGVPLLYKGDDFARTDLARV